MGWPCKARRRPSSRRIWSSSAEGRRFSASPQNIISRFRVTDSNRSARGTPPWYAGISSSTQATIRSLTCLPLSSTRRQIRAMGSQSSGISTFAQGSSGGACRSTESGIEGFGWSELWASAPRGALSPHTSPLSSPPPWISRIERSDSLGFPIQPKPGHPRIVSRAKLLVSNPGLGGSVEDPTACMEGGLASRQVVEVGEVLRVGGPLLCCAQQGERGAWVYKQLTLVACF